MSGYYIAYIVYQSSSREKTHSAGAALRHSFPDGNPVGTLECCGVAAVQNVIMAPAKERLVGRVDLPLYSINVVSERHIVVAGGGGKAKTGVANKIVSARL